MGKTKVSELAQKMGLESKDLLDRLVAAGVDAKGPASMIDDDDIRKLEAHSSRQQDRVEEERISTGIIRRRRKDVKRPEDEVAAEAERAEEIKAAPSASPEVKAPVVEAPVVAPKVEPVREAEAVSPEAAVAEKKVAEAPVIESPKAVVPEPAPAVVEKRAPVAEAVAVAPASAAKPQMETPAGRMEPAPKKPESAEPKAPAAARPQGPVSHPAPSQHAAAAAAQAQKQQKPTATKAKILGRVELPQFTPPGARTEAPRRDHGQGGRPGRPGDRPERTDRGERPAGAPRPERTDRPDRPAGAPRPDRGPRGDRPAGAPGSERPGGARPDRSDRPPRPAGGGFTPSLPVVDKGEVFVGKEVRGTKKKKGRADYDSETGGDQGKRGGGKRREVFEPDREDGKLRRGRSKQAKVLKKTEITVSKAIKRIIRITDVISVAELAKRMGVKANDLIKEMMRMGQMVTINHPLDFETAALLASEFQYEVENVAFDEESMLEAGAGKEKGEEVEEELELRPPVVTIMGHVDHGKTSLLDAIRTTNVTAGEAGGITQHIGAYDVELDGKKITFLDTPGHEAFTAMRARGAKATDIVVLVVAADDGVMPQTKEAINHSKAAGVPIIVAINKMDKPDANPDRVRQELTEFGLVSEDWGGETIFVEVSAKQRMNLDQLLEMILLQAEVMELKANPNKRAKGVVVEARLDKGRGPVATVLVQEGSLRVGDPIVTGLFYGRVRTMIDDRGNRVEVAGPSFPVEVTGLSGVPDAGDSFYSVEDEKVAKDVAQHRQQKLREAELARTSKISLEQLYAKIRGGEVKELKVIIKADVQGSVEAVKDSLLKLSTDACRLVVIHTGVGGIIESDVSLASASDAIVLGFNVRPEPKAATLAENEGVDIRLYNIIYDAVADIRDAMEGLLAPTYKEKTLGRVQVRETFVVSKVGTIAGCYVVEGKVQRGALVRLVRDNIVVWSGKMSSLKRFKDDVREVSTGYECGIGLENYNDLKVGDIVEVYEMEEVKTTL